MTDILHDSPSRTGHSPQEEGKTKMTDKTPVKERAKAYWAANLKLLGTLLVIWFVVSFGFGIVLRPVLDEIVIGGFPLGFWFAQQGSIYVFVALIFVYAARMRKIDRDFGVED